MARQLKRGTVTLADGTTMPESIASFHARQVEARQDAANRMRESRANKLSTIGDSIMQVYRLMVILWSEAIATETIVKSVVFGAFTLDTSAIMSIIKVEDRLAEISRLIRTPKQSQVVTDLLSAQLLGFRPVSSRVPTLIDSSIERVRLDAINPQRYHSPVKSGLSGRLAWDIIGASVTPQHGACIDTPRYWYDTSTPYQTRMVFAPWTLDYPVAGRYQTQFMSLGTLWESEHGYFAPMAIVTLDKSSHIGIKCDGRAHTGMERFIATGYVGSHVKLDRFSAPRCGYRQSEDCLHFMRIASMRDELDRKRAYSMTPLQSSMTPQAWIVDHTTVPDCRRAKPYGFGLAKPARVSFTDFAQSHGGLHVKAIGA